MKIKIIFSLVLFALSNTSYALEIIIGKVTLLEPTYLPSA